MGVREENLDPILDWEPINDSSKVKVECLKEVPMQGERVQTRKGRWGIGKYVGTTEFSAGKELIGLELEQWDPMDMTGLSKAVNISEH